MTTLKFLLILIEKTLMKKILINKILMKKILLKNMKYRMCLFLYLKHFEWFCYYEMVIIKWSSYLKKKTFPIYKNFNMISSKIQRNTFKKGSWKTPNFFWKRIKQKNTDMLVSDTEISLEKKKKRSINMVVNYIKNYLLPASNYSTK